jgi:hypothetical protein
MDVPCPPMNLVGMRDNVGAPFKRSAQVGRGKSIVDHQWNAKLAGNGGHSENGKNLNAGVTRVSHR